MRGDYQAAKDHLKNHVNGKSRMKDAQAAKLALSLKKHLSEDAPTNAVAHGGVDMNQNGGYKKADRRRKDHPDNMFRRANGVTKWVSRLQSK